MAFIYTYMEFLWKLKMLFKWKDGIELLQQQQEMWLSTAAVKFGETVNKRRSDNSQKYYGS